MAPEIKTINQEDTKILVGFKMTHKQRAVIKARATLDSVDMQEIFDEMVNDYFSKRPMTKSEDEMSKTIVEKWKDKRD